MAATLMLVTLPPAQAQAQSWQDLGGYLKKACTYVNGGGALPGGVEFGGDSNLQWVCTISSMYGFVENNILNGDWQGFAKDVIGRYITQLATHLTGKLGFGSFNKTVDALDEAMRGTYNQFRSAILGGMQNALAADGANRRDDNAGLPASTPGGLADYYGQSNPILSAAQTAGRVAQTVEEFKAADAAFRTKKVEEQSNKAITDVLEPAIAAATGTIGAPKLPGRADQLYKQAETALSTREVVVAQTKAITEAMKQDAVYNTSTLSLLAEIAKQNVMTNTELVQAKERAEAAQSDTENELKTYLEDYAEEVLGSAREVAQQVDRNAKTASSMMSPDLSSGAELGEYAP